MIQKNVLIVSLLASFTASAADFEDVARVIQVDPKSVSYNQPVRSCDQVVVQQQSQNISGAIVGAVAGGLLGGQVGKGKGRAVGAAVGAGTGAIVGNKIQNGTPTAGGEINCRMVDNFKTIITGYTITYDYRGQNFVDFIPASQNVPPPAAQPGDLVKLRVKLTPHS